MKKLNVIVASSRALVPVMLAKRRQANRSERAAYALLLGGALGNMLDRLARGYVVDFIHLHHWPVFNVADVLIVIGAALLLLGHWQAGPTPHLQPRRHT